MVQERSLSTRLESNPSTRLLCSFGHRNSPYQNLTPLIVGCIFLEKRATNAVPRRGCKTQTACPLDESRRRLEQYHFESSHHAKFQVKQNHILSGSFVPVFPDPPGPGTGC